MAQQTVGKRGIGVQISGDGNTVIVFAGAAELSLLRKHACKSEPQTELQLLRVDLRATTLVGRAAERSALDAWLESDRPVSARCITGRAGVGKTRLAIELCEGAAKASWAAGFVQYGQFPEFIRYATEWRWSTPTLVVIDYAAALARDLRRWMEILARPETQSGGEKLRLLLLERHAERDLGWWGDLLRPVSLSEPGPDELADPPEPVQLQSLSAVKDRRSLLAEIMGSAAKIANITPIPLPPMPGTNPDFDRRLGDDTINNEPLYLMMAGMEAIRTGAPAALALTRADLAERAASRERERLNHLASQWGISDKLLAHLALCITLQGGCDPNEALQLVIEEQRAMSFPEQAPATELVNRLTEALPIVGGNAVDAVRPDLIGEAFLLQGMQEHRLFPNVQTGIVERAWCRAGSKAAEVLVHTSQDFARGNADHLSVVWLRHLIDQADDLAALISVADELPQNTLALREVALLAQSRIVSAVAALSKDALELRPFLAHANGNLAIRLSALGQREPALEAALEAVALYRELAAQRPGAFRPDLALSLTNLANMLSDLGQREPALEAALEAVALYRELAAQRPEAFRPDLAGSLNNLANMLSDLGQREPALEAALEAVALYRELAAQRPDAFRPDLALSLNNLANRLSALGQREPALEAALEAVALYRELAAQRPDAFRPDLAGSLNNLANGLSALGQREPALEAVQEAVALYRELAAQRPDAFRPDLALSLTNLANRLSALGQREPALEAALEAVALYRELAAQRPDAFRPDLALSLTNLANRLSALGQREPALEAALEAVALYRELAAERPDAFRPDLALSLTNLANMLSDLGQREPALEAALEAVAIRRELAAQRPDAFRPDLALSLAVEANCLDAVERTADALASIAEAIAILSPVFVKQPAAFSQWMVPMVRQYLERCDRLQQEPDMTLLEPVVAIMQGRPENGR
jgi:tetratricopeptide (TPR) repeat protein